MKEKIMMKIKIASAVLAMALAVSIMLAGTFSWINFGQKASNELYREEGIEISLLVLEKDAAGVPTGKEVAGAEYYLYKVDASGDIQIGGRYVTDADGLIFMYGLEAGEYYFLGIRPAPGYIFDLDIGGQPVTRYDFTFTGVAPPDGIIARAYNRLLEGSLTINKIVENADGSVLTSGQLAEEFEFIVEIEGLPDGPVTVEIDGVPGQFMVSGATFRIKLRHGQSAALNGIPVGTSYRIAEAAKTGYIISSVNHMGNIPEEGIEAVFTNVYSPETHEGSLTVTKQAFDMSTGQTLSANSVFGFTISFAGYNAPDPIEYSVNGGAVQQLGVDGRFELGHLDSITFLNIPAGLMYTIEEDDVSGAGFVASPRMCTGIATDGGVTLPFSNYYDDDPGPKGPGALEITKLVTGDNLTANDYDLMFTFVVTFAGGGLPDPIMYSIDGGPPLQFAANGEIQLRHGQTARFENLPFGTEYTVTELADAGFLPIVQETGGFIAELETAYAIFINEKTHGMPDPEATITIRKDVVGEVSDRFADKDFAFRLLIDGAVFREFTLKDGESVTYDEVPAGAIYEVAEEDYYGEGFLRSITNGWGTVVDGESIFVIQANTFVAEVEARIEGEKTWDPGGNSPILPGSITVYLHNGGTLVASAIVTPGSDGRWVYMWDVPKYDTDGTTEIIYTVTEMPIESWEPEVTGFDIHNIYIPPAKLIGDPPVRKAIDGTPSVDAVFRFLMTGLDGAPMPEGSDLGSNTKILSIVGEGEDDFGDITYTRAGTYVYTIVEINTGEVGYSYDTGMYTLTVVVAEESGELFFQSRELARDGVLYSVALFTNIYDDSMDDMVNISGSKTWNHGANAPANHPGSITVLVRANGNTVVQRVVTASEGWSWSFVLNRNDGDGNAIVYTIDEVDVPGYTRQVSGYNITNTYSGPSGPVGPGGNGGDGPGSGSNEGNGNGPGGPGGGSALTGDDNNILLWLAVTIFSSYGMFILIIEARKRMRRRE